MPRLDLRLLHGLAAGAALFVLMGANAESCGGGAPPPEETTEPGEPGEPCPPGEHLELACGGSEPGWSGSGPNSHDPNGPEPCEEPPDCIEICVPDDVCPPGTFEELVCEPPTTEPGFPDGPQICLDPNGCEGPPPEPGQGECQLICVPEGACLPGEHEELICDEPMPPPQHFICLDPNGCEEPPPPPVEPGECFSVCVPDEECGPGEIVEWVCEPMDPQDYNEGEPPPPEPCFPVCVPMPEPVPQ